METQFDVVALGELLIDFTEHGTSAQGNSLFEACPGGAPCNVLAMLRKLGKSCAFVGKVGNDMFGNLLRRVIVEAGINADHLLMDDQVPTTLAFVQTLEGGDRDFSFYRKPGADMMLAEEELPLEAIQKAKIFHFGTLSMTHPGVRRATVKAVETAKQGGAWISFDPNIRPPLWADMEDARSAVAWGLSQCDILKIADNELLFMTGEEDFYRGAASLHRQYPNIQVLNVTAGADGSYSFYGEDAPVFVPSCKLGGVLETTGAGDTFCASVLNYILEHGIEGLSIENREEMLRFANTAAYLIRSGFPPCSKKYLRIEMLAMPVVCERHPLDRSSEPLHS
ncbi:carbohydrate kinase family protein, partial [Candidatus Avoscillospira sp. LCP25S3_F1]|uniref:carbohydrate kinase family protein n=1 Tax=Candidatus Avoscillospira sp. LCP25S3_F1 TaxID=3438825 RepID=UPI003F8DEE28